MLTKQDLKNIGDLIDLKLEEKLESKLEEKLESKLEEKLESKLAPIRKDIKKIKRIVEADFGYHEKHNMYVVKNVQQIQKHLGLPVMAFDPPPNFTTSN